MRKSHRKREKRESQHDDTPPLAPLPDFSIVRDYMALVLIGWALEIPTLCNSVLEWIVWIIKGGLKLVQGAILLCRQVTKDQQSNFDFFLFVTVELLRNEVHLPIPKRKSETPSQDVPHLISIANKHQQDEATVLTTESGGMGATEKEKSAADADHAAPSSPSSLLSHPPQEELISLQQRFPQSTEAERIRFLRARKGDLQAASDMLAHYLHWRSQYECSDDNREVQGTSKSATQQECLDGSSCSDENGEIQQQRELSLGDDPDEEDAVWTRACQSASPSPHINPPPCIVFMLKDNHTTHKKKRIIQHLPARIDLRLAEAEVYATALALYIDRVMPHDSLDKMCVVIDVRPGTGWCNIPASKLVPFIKLTAKLLNDLHPERLETCVLFPVPYVAKMLWNLVKQGLDPHTADKIQILSGSAGVDSPVPAEMEQIMPRHTVEWMEQHRISTFMEVQ